MHRMIARQSSLPLPDDAALGPAMKELTEHQQNFVIAMTEMGVSEPTAAARLAGYGGTDQSTKTAAKRLMRNPAVLAGLREEADKFLRGSVVIAARALQEIALDRNHRDRLKAADMLLNRADLIVKTTHEVIVTDKRTPDDVVAQIIEIARRTGQDPKALLGYDPKLPVVEAEFVEVSSEWLDEDVSDA
jgi:phage terminase small subunit